MRIQHNVPALNAHRNLTNNNSAVAKNLEKLSSGYRINRAGDDAAGLAISEKMRAQITGLQTAQKNAEDGVSLVQTAEGALTEVHSMLNRMVELATQSANGTYSDANRQEMQKEIDALEAEIDRISKTSNFNGTYLFSDGDDASTGDPTITGKVNGADIVKTDAAATFAKFESGSITTDGTAGGATDTVTIALKDGKTVELTVDLSAATTAEDIADAIVGAANAHADLKDIVTAAKNGTDKVTFTSKDSGADAPAVTNLAVKTFTNAGGSSIDAGTVTAGKNKSTTYNIGTAFKDGDSVTIGKETYTYKAGADGTDGKTFQDFATLQAAVNKNGNYKLDGTADAATVAEAVKTTAAQKEIVLHVGESASTSNQIAVKIDAMSSNSLKVDTVDITSAEGARTAINTINTAIDQVSSIRSSLGAMQNRLEHTINNLGVQTENITAAESRIRDVDMAKEMMAYTKNNILVQASQAMLAQANQVPQGVLQLLQ